MVAEPRARKRRSADAHIQDIQDAGPVKRRCQEDGKPLTHSTVSHEASPMAAREEPKKVPCLATRKKMTKSEHRVAKAKRLAEVSASTATVRLSKDNAEVKTPRCRWMDPPK